MTTVRWREERTSTRMMFSFATKTFSCCQENRRRCTQWVVFYHKSGNFHCQNIYDLDTNSYIVVSYSFLLLFFLPISPSFASSSSLCSPFHPVPPLPSPPLPSLPPSLPPFPSYLYPPLKLQPPRTTWWPGLRCTSWCLQKKEMDLQITHVSFHFLLTCWAISVAYNTTLLHT